MNELSYLKFVVAKQITVYFDVLNSCRFSATVVGSSVISAYDAFESSRRFNSMALAINLLPVTTTRAMTKCR